MESRLYYEPAPCPKRLRTIYNYVLNLQGDVQELRNAQTGAVVARYVYNAWGQILYMSGYMAEINPLRYRGYYYDSILGMYYLQSRYYDPVVGRFINADEFLSTGQGLLGFNMFAYCLNNPVNFYDPDGRHAAVIRAGANALRTAAERAMASPVARKKLASNPGARGRPRQTLTGQATGNTPWVGHSFEGFNPRQPEGGAVDVGGMLRFGAYLAKPAANHLIDGGFAFAQSAYQGGTPEIVLTRAAWSWGGAWAGAQALAPAGAFAGPPGRAVAKFAGGIAGGLGVNWLFQQGSPAGRSSPGLWSGAWWAEYYRWGLLN